MNIEKILKNILTKLEPNSEPFTHEEKDVVIHTLLDAIEEERRELTAAREVIPEAKSANFMLFNLGCENLRLQEALERYDKVKGK